MDSLNVVEIIPSVRRALYSEYIYYRRIKIEYLTQEGLINFFKIRHDKQASVTDIGTHFVYQYIGKPAVFINKTNGKVYGLKDDHLTRLQAIFLLQKLSKFSMVDGYHRKQYHTNYARWG